MTSQHATALLLRHAGTIAVIAASGLVLGIVLSFLRPLEYRSSIRLLITQEITSADAYTASRSAERVADDLAHIVFTTTFFDQVLASRFGVDETYFPSAESKAAKRRKTWNRMISASVARGTGLLSIDVHHRRPEQAKIISEAIAFVLTQQGWRYTSGGSISVRLVDEPLISRYPVRPNVPANGFVGLVIGVLIGGAFVLLRAEGEARAHRFMHA